MVNCGCNVIQDYFDEISDTLDSETLNTLLGYFTMEFHEVNFIFKRSKFVTPIA